MSHGRHPHRILRLAAPLVWLAILQLALSSLLAASEDLHEFLHPDSHDSGHHCLVTDIQNGHIGNEPLPPPATPAACEILLPTALRPASAASPLPIHLLGSLLEHGPPSRA